MPNSFWYQNGSIIYEDGAVVYDDECCCDEQPSLCGNCNGIFNGGDYTDPNNWLFVTACPDPDGCYCDVEDRRDNVTGQHVPWGAGEPQIGISYLLACKFNGTPPGP